MTKPLLEVAELVAGYPVAGDWLAGRKPGFVKAVADVSLRLQAGEILGLVGESGCGKSTLGRAIMQLVPAVAGRIAFAGRDLGALAPSELRNLRKRMQMIYQDPFASLNPRFTVYDIIAEPIRYHRLEAAAAIDGRVRELMSLVGLAPRLIRKYPHEFSGGQRQRIAIARALALRPELLIADEPVSALDISVQSQILNLLLDLRDRLRLTILFISHDLSVVKHVSDRIAVMYLGRLVETGDAVAVMEAPRHPYTRSLLAAVPTADVASLGTPPEAAVPGEPPSPLDPPAGCAFHPRCPHAAPDCARAVPALEAVDDAGHRVACMRWEELPANFASRRVQ